MNSEKCVSEKNKIQKSLEKRIKLVFLKINWVQEEF